MKILHVQNITGIAGSEMYLLSALPALKQAGHEIEFLCLYPKSSPGVYEDFKEKMEANGVKCHAIPFSTFPFVRTFEKDSSFDSPIRL